MSRCTASRHVAGVIHTLTVARNLVVLADLELRVLDATEPLLDDPMAASHIHQHAVLERLRADLTVQIREAEKVARALRALGAGDRETDPSGDEPGSEPDEASFF